MKQKTSVTPPAVGISSLLVMFAVLCLTIFALLSVSTVSADVTLGERSRDAVTNYYQADCQAEAVLPSCAPESFPTGSP